MLDNVTLERRAATWQCLSDKGDHPRPMCCLKVVVHRFWMPGTKMLEWTAHRAARHTLIMLRKTRSLHPRNNETTLEIALRVTTMKSNTEERPYKRVREYTAFDPSIGSCEVRLRTAESNDCIRSATRNMGEVEDRKQTPYSNRH
jgi:hypothetical protein